MFFLPLLSPRKCLLGFGVVTVTARPKMSYTDIRHYHFVGVNKPLTSYSDSGTVHTFSVYLNINDVHKQERCTFFNMTLHKKYIQYKT